MERVEKRQGGQALSLPEDRPGRWGADRRPYQTQRAVRAVTGPLNRIA
jgi:hypothetical protein